MQNDSAIPGAGAVRHRVGDFRGETREKRIVTRIVALPRWNAKVVTLTRRKPCAVTKRGKEKGPGGNGGKFN